MQKIDAPRNLPAPYEGYDVLEKWDTPSFNEQTRAVLSARMSVVPSRCFFSEDELSLLDAIIERLAPPVPDLQPALLALWIDERLFKNLGEGFRKVGEPPLQESWRRGLAAIDGEARRLFSAPFVRRSSTERDMILQAVQGGKTEAALWRGLDPAGFFSDMLLKTVVGLAYAHPLAWNDIGFGGPASPRGYVRLGFDERDPWEAKERR